MISWDRCGNSIIVVFTPRQIRWLRKHLTDYRRRVDRALEGNVDDPAIFQIYLNGQAANPAPLEAQLQRTRSAITTTLAALPKDGGVLEIHEDHRLTWVWSLHELQSALTARLEATTARTEATKALTDWLSTIVDTVLDAGPPAVAPTDVKPASDPRQ